MIGGRGHGKDGVDQPLDKLLKLFARRLGCAEQNGEDVGGFELRVRVLAAVGDAVGSETKSKWDAQHNSHLRNGP